MENRVFLPHEKGRGERGTNHEIGQKNTSSDSTRKSGESRTLQALQDQNHYKLITVPLVWWCVGYVFQVPYLYSYVSYPIPSQSVLVTSQTFPDHTASDIRKAPATSTKETQTTTRVRKDEGPAFVEMVWGYLGMLG